MSPVNLCVTVARVTFGPIVMPAGFSSHLSISKPPLAIFFNVRTSAPWCRIESGAGDRSGPGSLTLGKVALSQVSYARATGSLRFDHCLGLRRGFGDDRAHELRVLADEAVGLDGVQGRGDDVIFRPVRIRHHPHPPAIDEHPPAPRDGAPLLPLPLHPGSH